MGAMRNKVIWLSDLFVRRRRSTDPAPTVVPEIAAASAETLREVSALPDADRAMLERWARSRSAPFKLVLRSRIVLMVHSGVSMAATAKSLSTTPRTVRLWCRRYGQGGVEALRREAPGRGRRAGLSAETVERIVTLTLSPADGQRPTARVVAAAVGTSPASVCRVWAARGIRPARGKEGRGAHARPGGHERADDRAPRCETAGVDGRSGAVAGQLLPSL